MFEERRFKRKANAGNHVYHYQGVRHKVSPGEITICPTFVLGAKALEWYDDLGPVSQDGEKGDSVPASPAGKELKEKKRLELRKRKRGGFYDIVNPDNPDKPLNEKALREDEAIKMIEELSGEAK